MRKTLVFLMALMGIFNQKFVHNCRPTTIIKEYFPGGENGVAKAFVLLKGQINGSQIIGRIQFEQKGINGAVQITGNITGLPATTTRMKHGLHVHAYTLMDDLNDVTRCGTSGGHFNPTNSAHGDISARIRHVGDLGNVEADTHGVINIKIVDQLSKLYGPYGIIGRTIVLHQLKDDLGLVNNTASLVTGNSGSRIACGIIGIMSY